MIRFEEITNKNIWEVCALEPFENQKDFVAENIQSLAEAYATRNEGNNALPLAVYDDDTLIGFVMIGKGTVGNEEESDLIKENYCLWRLMIDKKYQGKGLGLKTLEAAIALIRSFPFGEAKRVWLSYDLENTRARNIYLKFGFVETGEKCGSETVAVYDLYPEPAGAGPESHYAKEPGKMKLSVIFDPKPERWGFRGDPYFWDYLKELAENMDVITPDELEAWIGEEYLSLSGKPLTGKYMDFAIIEQFEHGGMSSGGVDNTWWTREGIPLLKSRLLSL